MQLTVDGKRITKTGRVDCRNFMELAVAGVVEDLDVYVFIDHWQNSTKMPVQPIYAYLGMTPFEYHVCGYPLRSGRPFLDELVQRRKDYLWPV